MKFDDILNSDDYLREVLMTAKPMRLQARISNVMIRQFHEKFFENYENTVKIISDLVDHINDNDIPHVEKYINWLESGW
jgi:hypothetical protein